MRSASNSCREWIFQDQAVEESFPHGPEVSFHLGFGGTVPYRCVQEYGADGAADEGELFIDVGEPLSV